MGSELTGVLYILDEPSIGLHQRDNRKLLNSLCHLRDIGNTLIIVEHDKETIETEVKELIHNLHHKGGFIAKIYRDWKNDTTFDPSEYSKTLFKNYAFNQP